MRVNVGADAFGLSVLRGGDVQQAEYFLRLLDLRKSEACELLETHLDSLARLQRAGDLTGVRRRRQIVKAFESELRTLDRMLVALRIRLGLPVLRRTL